MDAKDIALIKALGGGGSGGSGGGFNPTIVTLDMATFKLSLTPAEIQAKREAGEMVFFSFMGALMPILMTRDSSGAIISARAVNNPIPYEDNKMQMSTLSFDADGSLVGQNIYSWEVIKEA